jgi:hypothetical protein
MTQQTGVLAATTTEEKGANARLVRFVFWFLFCSAACRS